MKIEKAAVESERRTVEADLGPAQYLGAVLGQADEVVLRWFILVVAPARRRERPLFDPLPPFSDKLPMTAKEHGVAT